MVTGMRLDKLLEYIDCETVNCTDSCEVTGIVCDSRQVRAGNLFVAIKGSKQDGVSFMSNAFEQGAAGVVSLPETLISGKVCRIKVSDPRLAAGVLADAFNDNPSSDLEVIGITGTNGKTTTAYMIRDILRDAERVPGLMEMAVKALLWKFRHTGLFRRDVPGLILISLCLRI
jgi:UDP-N-acetylmuramoyl-L-alanyl-D-glutamate--2,6-diaminopimelate ligase